MIEPPRLTWINVKPASYDRGARIFASAQADQLEQGLRMEVHSSHTEFYADPDVPIGQVSVWVTRTYKGQLQYDTTLTSPGEEWSP
jgi:hypothetical protein